MIILVHDNSIEDEVVLAMHKMTHQKIKAEEKWGVIPMTAENIEEINTILDSRGFPNGDFSTIAEDHNYLW